MKVFKVLNNQSGMMAMMGAMIFTIAITTTLSTFYVYTLNQAKYHARIKEAYQLINIMESFATATRKAYDMGMSASAKSENCPSADGTPNAGPTPSPISGTTPQKFYCPPTTADGETCFRREDTNEEYCSVIQFASNLEIKRQEMYVENNPNSFLKSWRKGLNDFFISPGIKDRIVDTSTMAYVMKRPLLLDWLVSEAKADEQQVPGLTSGGTHSPLDNGNEGDGALVGQSGYVNCDLSTSEFPHGSICITSYPSTVPGGAPIPSQRSCPSPMTDIERARFCNNCANSNQFCPGVGADGSERGGIFVQGGEGAERKFLPVRQTFSIVM